MVAMGLSVCFKYVGYATNSSLGEQTMHQHFFRTYQQAREHFIKACCDFKGELTSIKHPEQGPDGDIFMDIGCFGDKSAQRVVVISSGTHGVEGYTGSGSNLYCFMRAYALDYQPAHVC